MSRFNESRKEAWRVLPGDHVLVHRVGYTHHGIYVGSSNVIHFNREEDAQTKSSIQENGIDDFLKGSTLIVRVYQVPTLTHEESMRIAWGFLNEYKQGGHRGYNLFNYNCETLAAACRLGHPKTTQYHPGKPAGTWYKVVGILGNAPHPVAKLAALAITGAGLAGSFMKPHRNLDGSINFGVTLDYAGNLAGKYPHSDVRGILAAPQT